MSADMNFPALDPNRPEKRPVTKAFIEKDP